MSLIVFYIFILSGVQAMVIPMAINQNRRERASVAANHLLQELADETRVREHPSRILPINKLPMYRPLDESSWSATQNHDETVFMYEPLPILPFDDDDDEFDDDLPLLIATSIIDDFLLN